MGTSEGKGTPAVSPKGSPRCSDKSSPLVHDQDEPQPEPQQGLLHGDASIEAGGIDSEDEFSASNLDAETIASDSTSLSSSVYAHSFKNGRRYHRHRHGRYPLPNDEAEQNREDMLHAMMLEATDGRLFYAPVGEFPQKVVDLGTGTGIWALRPAWVPPNVKFLVDDVENEWLNGDDIDFVHLRNMIPILKSPVGLLKQAITHMRPGGWVELQDVDGQCHSDDDTIPDDWPIKRFTEQMVQGFARFGTNSHAAVFGGQYLAEAGFVNIKHNYVKLPYGTGPRDKTMRLVGMYYRTACEDFFPAVGAVHFPRMGWKKLEMELFFAECRKSMRDPKVHVYGKMHFWSGQKPLEADDFVLVFVTGDIAVAMGGVMSVLYILF